MLMFTLRPRAHSGLVVRVHYVNWTHMYASHRADLQHQHHPENRAATIKSDYATKTILISPNLAMLQFLCFNPSSHPMSTISAFFSLILPIFYLNSGNLIVLREDCYCERVTWHQINGGFEIGMLDIWRNRFFTRFRHLSFEIFKNIVFHTFLTL